MDIVPTFARTQYQGNFTQVNTTEQAFKLWEDNGPEPVYVYESNSVFHPQHQAKRYIRSGYWDYQQVQITRDGYSWGAWIQVTNQLYCGLGSGSQTVSWSDTESIS